MKVTAAGRRQRPLLARQTVRLRQVDARRLEQLNRVVGDRLVHAACLEQAGDQAHPQRVGAFEHRRVGGQRRSVAPGTDRVAPLPRHDARRHRFVEAGRRQSLPDPFQHAILVRAMRRSHRHAHVLGNLVVAVNSRHLLDQVDLPRQIPPPGGRHELQRLASAGRPCVAQRRQDPFHFVAGISMPSTRGNWLRRSVIGGRLVSGAPTSSTPGASWPPASSTNQLAAAATGPVDAHRIDAAFKAIRRRTVQPELAGRRANRQRRKLRRLDQQIRGRPETSDSTPPITPPSATRRWASAITHMPGSSG